MRASNILLALGFAALVALWAADAGATPLQSRLDVPQMSGTGLDFGASSSRVVVNPIIDVSGDGGLVGPGPFSPPPLVGQELLRPLPSSDSLRKQSTTDLPGSSGPDSSSPSVEIFREIISEATGSQPAPGFGLASTATRRPGANEAVRRRVQDSNDDQQVSLKDLVRLLINQPENLGLEAPVAVRAGAAGTTAPESDSILNAILSVTVDKEIVQALSRVLRPSVDLKGVVALNIFGLREIAVLVSPSSNSIRMVDLGSGRSMSFRYEERGGASSALARRNAGQPNGQQNMIQRENLLPNLLATIRHWIQTYVLSGVTLISLGSLSIFWVVWRFARSERG